MKIGLISDTHNFLDPRVPEIFAGVDHILHAGDVGQSLILVELEQIAPVTAVFGNTDDGLPLRETETVELGGKKFLIHHIVSPGARMPGLDRRLRDEAPDVVVFGHTHKAFAQEVGGVLYFNPGYAGKQRFDLSRSVAVMEVRRGRITHRFVALP